MGGKRRYLDSSSYASKLFFGRYGTTRAKASCIFRLLNNRFSSAEVSYFLIANILVLGTAAYASALDSGYPDFYYFSIQEDEYLEWSSFWAFLLAAVAYFRRAVGYCLATDRFPWYLYGVVLFCFIVAMEEISWGQRLLGYQPPTYFLEHNYQQEFNFHNVVETDYRKLALTLVIAGYGIVLPLAGKFRYLKSWFKRIGIVAPTIALLPAFSGTFLVYFLYPWSHSGEWVELMLGLGFLLSAVRMPRDYSNENQPLNNDRFCSSKIAATAFVAVIGLGLISGAASRMQRDAHPANLQAARNEVEAISRDFENGFAKSRCNLHKRQHNYQQEFNFHNVVETDYRKLALTLVIAGYGIVLPLAGKFRYLKSWFKRIGIVAPTIALLPAFSGTFLVYFLYPWSHSGEWVELMLGLGFLLSAVRMPRDYSNENQPLNNDRFCSSKIAATAFVAVIGLGLISGAASRMQRDAHPANLQAARNEVEAISRDFENGFAKSRCNLHKRLYTFVEDYGQKNLFKGSYSELQSQGLPEQRAEFFLDPWNSPYWIRDRCDRNADRRVTFIYSFGPNRRRDSTRTEIQDDDIGSYISAK